MGSTVGTVGVQFVGLGIFFLKVFHIVDSIACIILSLDDDDIIFGGLDGFTLLAGVVIAQRNGSMLLLGKRDRSLLGNRRIVNGDIALIDGEHQHVFVLEGITIDGHQQAEVVEHWTYVTALLALIFCHAVCPQLQLSCIGIHLQRLEDGLPALALELQVGNNNRVAYIVTVCHDADGGFAAMARVDAGDGGNAEHAFGYRTGRVGKTRG